MRRVFVTGATGFTGSHLVRRLNQLGVEVTGLVRPSSDRSRLQGCDITLIEGDLGDRATLERAMQGIDWVFHTAAYVELGIVDAAQMERTNVAGTQAVVQAAQAAGVAKLVYCSTIGVYGDTQGRAIDETFVRQQQGFSSAYDRTKYLAQQIVDQAATQGLSTVSLMPSGIFGADDPHFGPVLKSFLQGKLKLWAGGQRITGIVHVDDLVEAMLLAAEKGASGEHYIISAGELTTREMFDIFGRAAGVSAPAEAPKWLVRFAGNLLDPIGRSLNWQPPISRERVHYIYDRCVRVDASKARRELGWNPRDPETVLQEICTALRSPKTLA
jgi:dihydroflavonol-4-reductase